MRVSQVALGLLVVSNVLACRSRESVDAAKAPAEAPLAAEKPKADSGDPKIVEAAAVGKPAPDFTLTDLDGNSVKLSALRGKPVVLEWFNPACPFVKASHTKGSLVGTAERHRQAGVVWFAINSGGPGKQGAGREENSEARERFALKHPILLDPTGAVGKLYGAKTTPHIFIINSEGDLAYRGAIDNSPDGEGESPKDGKLVNYADEALAAIQAGKPVPHAETEPYGCSVKYVN